MASSTTFVTASDRREVFLEPEWRMSIQQFSPTKHDTAIWTLPTRSFKSSFTNIVACLGSYGHQHVQEGHTSRFIRTKSICTKYSGKLRSQEIELFANSCKCTKWTMRIRVQNSKEVYRDQVCSHNLLTPSETNANCPTRYQPDLAAKIYIS